MHRAQDLAHKHAGIVVDQPQVLGTAQLVVQLPIELGPSRDDQLIVCAGRAGIAGDFDEVIPRRRSDQAIDDRHGIGGPVEPQGQQVSRGIQQGQIELCGRSQHNVGRLLGRERESIQVVALVGHPQNCQAIRGVDEPYGRRRQVLGRPDRVVVRAVEGLIFEQGVEHNFDFISTGAGQRRGLHRVGPGRGNRHGLDQDTATRCGGGRR